VLAFSLVNIGAMRRLDVWERGGLQERGRGRENQNQKAFKLHSPHFLKPGGGGPAKVPPRHGRGKVDAQKIKGF
jgi:hypothetical protein